MIIQKKHFLLFFKCKLKKHQIKQRLYLKIRCYKELNEKANSLAYFLRNKQNVKKESTVGIMVNRSLEMIVAILGVMKAGGVYIPIDPNFPEDRINYMLETSSASILLISEKLKDKVNYKNKFSIDL